MALNVHVIGKTLSVQTMIIYKKYKKQIVIKLHENHRPNTVYLKSTGRSIQKYTLPYSKLFSNTPNWKNDIPNKARKYKICTNVFLTHYCTTMFQPNLISIVNFLRNQSRRRHLQNMDNMTSKKLRPLQIETKSLKGKGVSTSLLLSLQKVQQNLG